MDPTFWAALIEPVTNTVDDLWYTEGEEAEINAALAISENNLLAAAISAEQWTNIGIIALVVLGAGILLYFILKNRKKSK